MSLMHPRPVATVVTRRHPLAFAMYAMIFVLGLIFIFHWFGTHKTQDALFPGISPWIIFAWKWMMTVGSGLALTSLLAKPRVAPHWPDIADLLHLEGIGAVVSAFGLATYTVALVELIGFHAGEPALVIYCILITGHLVRGTQAFLEARRLTRMVTALAVEEQRDE